MGAPGFSALSRLAGPMLSRPPESPVLQKLPTTPFRRGRLPFDLITLILFQGARHYKMSCRWYITDQDWCLVGRYKLKASLRKRSSSRMLFLSLKYASTLAVHDPQLPALPGDPQVMQLPVDPAI